MPLPVHTKLPITMSAISEAVPNGWIHFVPSLLYETEAQLLEQYRAYCVSEHMCNVLEEEDSADSEDESDEDSEDGEDKGGGVARKLIYSPPLYSQEDLYHPLHDRDFRLLHFTSRNSFTMMAIAPSQSRLRSGDDAGNRIRIEALSMIQSNRKDHAGIRNARKSMVTIDARLAGIKRTISRKFQVPGNTLLSTLHDRVLCPLFGWTRAYHDYRYAIPPCGYPQGAPSLPCLNC